MNANRRDIRGPGDFSPDLADERAQRLAHSETQHIEAELYADAGVVLFEGCGLNIWSLRTGGAELAVALQNGEHEKVGVLLCSALADRIAELAAEKHSDDVLEREWAGEPV